MHSENSDNFEYSEIESCLSGMRPLRLDAEFSRRLEGLLGDGAAQSEAELALERELRRHAPLALTPKQFARFAALLDEAPAVDVEKVVAFPKVAEAGSKRRRSSWASVAAVAAVAILGGWTAWNFPGGNAGKGGHASTAAIPAVAEVQSTAKNTAPASANVATDKIVPAGFNRGVRSAQDEGVVWDKGQGRRIVKVEYLDKAVIEKNGKSVEVEQPRVEYLVVPEKVD